MATEFRLPDLGENIESGNVTRVMVAKGDTIRVDQPVIEVETDKAALEVPSSVAGTVVEVRAEEGKPIKVGAVVLVVSEDASSAAEPAKPKPEPKPEPPEQPRKAVAPVAPVAAARAKETPPETPKPAEEPEPASEELEPSSGERVTRAAAAPAAPSVRRLAREIGVDVNQVSGSGPGGRVTVEDVKAHARVMNVDSGGTAAPAARGAATPSAPLPDFARWGAIERRPMGSVRRRTGERMARAWATIPQVTQFDKADVTDLEKLRKQFGKRVEAAGGKLTMTAILVKVVAAALKRFPQFNVSLDVENGEVIQKDYYHIGVAVDTDRGLLVPVLRDADRMNLTEISVALSELAARARDRKTTLDEMQGGVFTISNLGGIGGTGFTPIVNPPEVAILGVSRGAVEPVFVDGDFRPRTMLPLALTYDHRAIDGADGARFLRWICEALEQPFLLFLEG